MNTHGSTACPAIYTALLIAVILLVLPISAHAVITATHLTEGGDPTQQFVYTTASISPGAFRLVLAWVSSSENGGAPAPTLSGNGLTWVQINTVTWNTDYRLTLFRAMGAAPTAGSVTITFASKQKVGAWSIEEFDGVDLSGANGSGAIVQNLAGSNDGAGPAGLTITLPQPISAGNATAGGFANNSLAASIIPGAGYAGFPEVATGNPPDSLRAEWRAAGSTTVNVTQSGSFPIAGIAVEIKAITTTIGNGTAPSNKTVNSNDTNKAVDAFTLVTSGGTDTVTALTVTFSGTAVGDVAAGGVKIWKDNGTTPNEWDASDTLIATASFSGTTATFSGLTITVTTTSTQYLITYDIAASPGAADTLQAAVTAATVTNTLVSNDAVDATLTVTRCPGGIVTTIADAGNRTLRECINFANTKPGTTISFNIATAANQSSGADSWWRITTASALPSITASNTSIDGTTQTTNRGNTNSKGPEIEIFGNGITASGLSVSGAANVTIKSLVINSFAGASPNGDGIYVNNATNTSITGCYLGTNAIASAALANGYDGIQINGSSSGTIIGGSSAGAGNIISGNSVRYGIELSGTSNNTTIKGNTIGTGFLGTENLPNRTGIMVNTSAAVSNNVIGGVYAGEGNVVANSSFEGIYLSMSGTGDTILGNTVRNNGPGGGGIYSKVAGVVIAKNVSYSNAEPGITLDAGANNNKVYQNTVNGNTGFASDGIQVTGNGAIIKNNIVTGNGRFGINRLAVAMTESYNDVTDTNASGKSNVGLDPMDLNANPLYINAAGGNFSLTECTSPAINRGTDLGADQPDMNGGSPGLWNNNAPDLGAFETSSACVPALTIVKQLWVVNGAVPISSPANAASGSTLVFLIYIRNTTAGQVTDIRINDILDQTGFDYVPGSLVRTSAATPPADTATDLQIFNATAPGTGTPLTDIANAADVGSAQDTGGPVGVDLIRIGAGGAPPNASLNIAGNTTFAFRFQVKVK